MLRAYPTGILANTAATSHDRTKETLNIPRPAKLFVCISLPMRQTSPRTVPRTWSRTLQETQGVSKHHRSGKNENALPFWIERWKGTQTCLGAKMNRYEPKYHQKENHSFYSMFPSTRGKHSGNLFLTHAKSFRAMAQPWTPSCSQRSAVRQLRPLSWPQPSYSLISCGFRGHGANAHGS